MTKKVNLEMNNGNSLEEIKSFLRCYNDSYDFRKMVIDDYYGDRKNLSKSEIILLDELEKRGNSTCPKDFDIVISEKLNEYSFETKLDRLKSAIMMFVSDAIKEEFGYKDGMVPSCDYEKIYSKLHKLLSSYKRDSIMWYYTVITNFTAYNDVISRDWFSKNKATNVDIPNIIDFMSIDVDMLPDLQPFGKVIRKNSWY